MKKNKGLICAAAALAILCAAYGGIGLAVKGSSEKAKEKSEQEIIYMTDLPSVTAVSYDYDGKELSFTKKEDTWRYDGDDKFPVKQGALDSLAGTASKLTAVRKLEGGDGLSAYGLDTPKRKVSAAAEDGTKAVILLGEATPDGDYYALLEGEDTPYLIGSELFTETDRNLDEWMALEEFPGITGSDIQEITITKEENTEHFVKKKLDDEAGTIAWYKDSAEKEENKLEDNSQLNVLADSLSSLKVKNCVNYKVTEEELSGYGLASPLTVLEYSYDKNGSVERFALEVGGRNEEGDSYYTRTEGSPNINEIDGEEIDKILTVAGEI